MAHPVSKPYPDFLLTPHPKGYWVVSYTAPNTDSESDGASHHVIVPMFFTLRSSFPTKQVLASKNVEELNVQTRNPMAKLEVKQRNSAGCGRYIEVCDYDTSTVVIVKFAHGLGYSPPDLQMDAKDGADTSAFVGRLVPNQGIR